MVELMEAIKCTICGKPFETEKARISHDNRTHGGQGTKLQTLKYCNGCKAYRVKEDFYKLNDGLYSRCKECSGDKKEEWIETTTAGFEYSRRKNTISQRYRALVKWAENSGYNVCLTLEEYTFVIKYGFCNSCSGDFQGIAFCDIYQPEIGLTIGNTRYICAICHTKKKYHLR
jgi:hypothetical protein